VIADGSVLLAEGNLIRRLTPAGGTGALTFGAGLSPDNCWSSADALDNVVYALDACLGKIYTFNLQTGNLIGFHRQWTQAELNAKNAYPSRIHIFRFGNPEPKPIIYVHGLQQPQNAGGFNSVLDDPLIAPHVQRFGYFQDALVESCAAQPRLSSQLLPPSLPMPILDGTTSPGQPYCDSESDISLNVLLLHRDIQSAYWLSGGQKVILIGFSMGAAVIRGVLTYSAYNGDNVAQSMVDSVIFVAGALDGSESAKCELFGQCPPGTTKLLIDLASPIKSSGIDTSRPAITQLLPQSPWYQWANPGPLPEIGYYEAHANLKVEEARLKRRWVDLPWGPDVPIVQGHSTTIWKAGDGVLAPGSYENPWDTPPEGGASFSRPNTQEQWTWVFCSDDLRADLRSRTGATIAVLNSPCFHSNIPWNLDDPKFKVTDCKLGGQITLAAQLRKILWGKIGQAVYSCPMHP
jgi:pimeloyl-ACP methyl ester carboxylesterase